MTMIWQWYDNYMTWYDMLCYVMLCYGIIIMIWYDMTWYDMIQYDIYIHCKYSTTYWCLTLLSHYWTIGPDITNHEWGSSVFKHFGTPKPTRQPRLEGAKYIKMVQNAMDDTQVSRILVSLTLMAEKRCFECLSHSTWVGADLRPKMWIRPDVGAWKPFGTRAKQTAAGLAMVSQTGLFSAQDHWSWYGFCIVILSLFLIAFLGILDLWDLF